MGTSVIETDRILIWKISNTSKLISLIYISAIAYLFKF